MLTAPSHQEVEMATPGGNMAETQALGTIWEHDDTPYSSAEISYLLNKIVKGYCSTQACRWIPWLF
jgi:hypothetical protein